MHCASNFNEEDVARKLSREEADAMEHLNTETVQSWGDTKPLSAARFLQSAQGISLTDLQCIEV